MNNKCSKMNVQWLMVLGLSFIICFDSFSNVSAQGTERITIKEVFITMTDSLTPYLSQNNKLDLIDFMESDMEAKVTNSLNGTSRMDTLNDQFLSLTLNEASKVQMRLLPVIEPVDSMQQIICLVRTIGVKGQESTVSFYSCSWHPLQLSINDVFSPDDILVQPASMSDERFRELKTMLLPFMFWATLSESEDVITIRLSEQYLSTNDFEEIQTIKTLIKLKWNGRLFNKV